MDAQNPLPDVADLRSITLPKRQRKSRQQASQAATAGGESTGQDQRGRSVRQRKRNARTRKPAHEQRSAQSADSTQQLEPLPVSSQPARKRRWGMTFKHGRPTTLNDKVQQEICEKLARGVTLKYAAESSGIPYETATGWRRRGCAEQDTIYSTFAQLTQKAMAEGVVTRLGKIEQAGNDGAWQAHAWTLERLDPEFFAVQKRVEHSGQVNHAVAVIPVQSGELADGQLAAILAALGRNPPIETTAVPALPPPAN